MKQFRYKAYISYSHKDERWAQWLHNALESYHVPRRLRGFAGPWGPVPERLSPVFRDRDELTASTDLGEKINQALDDSECLVVVCSPSAADSHWVNEEIRYFQASGRAERIYCMIVDGEPGAADAGNNCFPPALLASLGETAHEPLAADVRKWADGRILSKLKLIAGILGIPLDQLRRREHQRQKRRRILVGAAMAALAVIVFMAITSRQAAEQRRDSGETLVALKLSELRQVLQVEEDPEALLRLDKLDQASKQAAWENAGASIEGAVSAAMVLRDLGLHEFESDQIDASLRHFLDSWTLLALAYRESDDEIDILFELGQAEFWIGYAYLYQGDLDTAENCFVTYAEITRRLIEQDPENGEFVLEMSYALTNLGGVRKERAGYNPDRTLQLMQSALEYNQIALVLDPKNELYRAELGQSHVNLADAQQDVCDLEGALDSSRSAVDHELHLLAGRPEDIEAKTNLAYALGGYARVQEYRGITDGALQSLQGSRTLLKAVTDIQPDDAYAAVLAMDRGQRAAWLYMDSGDPGQARELLNQLSAEWGAFLDDGESENITTSWTYFAYLIDLAWFEFMRGDVDLAVEYLDAAIAGNTQLLSNNPGNRMLQNQLTVSAFRRWEITGQLPAAEIMALMPEYPVGSKLRRACRDASVAMLKWTMLKERDKAAEYANYLVGKDYREAGFVRVCQEYDLCRLP